MPKPDRQSLTRTQIESLLNCIETTAEQNGTYSKTQLETKQILKQMLKPPKH